MEQNFIIQKVKEIAHRYDSNAQVILFGSRARGDWNAESDWDFLILIEKEYTDKLFDKMRADVWQEIEMTTFQSVQTIIRNKKVWEENLWMTGIYESIKEEGIEV